MVQRREQRDDVIEGRDRSFLNDQLLDLLHLRDQRRQPAWVVHPAAVADGDHLRADLIPNRLGLGRDQPHRATFERLGCCQAVDPLVHQQQVGGGQRLAPRVRELPLQVLLRPAGILRRLFPVVGVHAVAFLHHRATAGHLVLVATLRAQLAHCVAITRLGDPVLGVQCVAGGRLYQPCRDRLVPLRRLRLCWHRCRRGLGGGSSRSCSLRSGFHLVPRLAHLLRANGRVVGLLDQLCQLL